MIVLSESTGFLIHSPWYNRKSWPELVYIVQDVSHDPIVCSYLLVCVYTLYLLTPVEYHRD
jgi:hypothetical protein